MLSFTSLHYARKALYYDYKAIQTKMVSRQRLTFAHSGIGDQNYNNKNISRFYDKGEVLLVIDLKDAFHLLRPTKE